MGTLTIPIWAAGAASAVFLALAILAIGRAGVTASIDVVFRVAIVAIAVSAGWVYIQRMERQEYAAEIRSLDERSAALVARAVAPGSALPCLDEIAGEAVVAACEKAVFASAETVAAAVSYVAAKLAMLAERSELAGRADPTFGAEAAPLLTALDTDRFGIVAHVLAQHHACTPEKCDALSWFDDPSRVLANLRDHTFDEEVTKFAAAWGSPPRAAMEGAAATDSPPTASPGFSQHYEFPSSQSIPPVNIMVPEPQAPRVGAPNGQSAAPSGDGRPATTPVPPRRPAQGRASGATFGSRSSSPRPAAPVAVGDAPTDGAATRASSSGQPQ
jgi:hypothetical protein